ncbi:MAG: hypothetical protein RL030_2755 [Pseudomonadota bacterium]|jgi:hypothetical protein
MPLFSDLILEPSKEPANPQAGQLWVPPVGHPDAGELHIWSPRHGAWLNLFDDRITARKTSTVWRRVLRALRLVK